MKKAVKNKELLKSSFFYGIIGFFHLYNYINYNNTKWEEYLNVKKK